MAMARKHIIIRGWVQGVFFRSNLQEKANLHRVTGWVRNNSDGSVEAVLEGDGEAVEKVVSWCYRGPRGARVEDVRVTPGNYTGEFPTFSIRYREW